MAERGEEKEITRAFIGEGGKSERERTMICDIEETERERESRRRKERREDGNTREIMDLEREYEEKG